jgi:radical SAM protein with 4Fe4S-binding SPASM domain
MDEEIISRLLNWAKGKKDYPYSIELSPTLRCNLNCLFCWRYGKKVNYGKELSLKDYEKILMEAKELKVKEVRIIGGGEPLVRKDTLKVMERVKKLEMFGYICTNGTLFTERMIEKLVKIGWDHVKISFHSPDKKTQDFIAQKESFEKIVKNIKTFEKWKKLLRTKKPKIEIGMVLNRINFKQVVEMVKLAKGLNVQSFFIEPLTVYTNEGEKLRLKTNEVKEFGKLAREAYLLANGLETNLQQFFSPEIIEKTGEMIEEIKRILKRKEKDFFSIPCYEPWYRMGIRVDGKVCPCGFLDEESWENVKEKSLEEIWFGEYFNLRRKQIFEGKLPKHCKKCCITLVANNKIIRNELEKFRFL